MTRMTSWHACAGCNYSQYTANEKFRNGDYS
jgi:hypothetical protein